MAGAADAGAPPAPTPAHDFCAQWHTRNYFQAQWGQGAVVGAGAGAAEQAQGQGQGQGQGHGQGGGADAGGGKSGREEGEATAHAELEGGGDSSSSSGPRVEGKDGLGPGPGSGAGAGAGAERDTGAAAAGRVGGRSSGEPGQSRPSCRGRGAGAMSSSSSGGQGMKAGFLGRGREGEPRALGAPAKGPSGGGGGGGQGSASKASMSTSPAGGVAISAPSLEDVGPPVNAAEEKERGNELYRHGRFDEAVRCYSHSLALEPTAVAFANRAMAFLKLGLYEDAERDCTLALERDDEYVKALSRRATARLRLKRPLDALQDVELAEALEPGSKELAALRAEAEKAARSVPGAREKGAPSKGPGGSAKGMGKGNGNGSAPPPSHAPPQARAPALALGREGPAPHPKQESTPRRGSSTSNGTGPGMAVSETPVLAALDSVVVAQGVGMQGAMASEGHQGAVDEGGETSSGAHAPVRITQSGAHPAEAQGPLGSGGLSTSELLGRGAGTATCGGHAAPAPAPAPAPAWEAGSFSATPIQAGAAPESRSSGALQGSAHAQGGAGAAPLQLVARSLQLLTEQRMGRGQSGGQTPEGRGRAGSEGAREPPPSTPLGLKAPQYAFELEAAWRALSALEDGHSTASDAPSWGSHAREHKLQYLKMIEPEQLPGLLKDSLSGPLLWDILLTLLRPGALRSGEAPWLVTFLGGLLRTPRFSIASLCLTHSMRADVEKAWTAALGEAQPALSPAEAQVLVSVATALRVQVPFPAAAVGPGTARGC